MMTLIRPVLIKLAQPYILYILKIFIIIQNCLTFRSVLKVLKSLQLSFLSIEAQFLAPKSLITKSTKKKRRKMGPETK